MIWSFLVELLSPQLAKASRCSRNRRFHRALVSYTEAHTHRDVHEGQGSRALCVCVWSYCLCCLAVGLEGVHLLH